MKIIVCNNIGSKLAKAIFEEIRLDKNIDIEYADDRNPYSLINKSSDKDVVFWFVDTISVKKANPTALVVGVQELQTSFVDMLNKSLIKKDNLTIATNESSIILYDPLGTEWYEGVSVIALVRELMDRIVFLLKTHRERTYKTDRVLDVPDNEEFFKYVRDVGEIFHKTVPHTDGVTRLMGNASFRGNDDVIYTSERDMDKSLITRKHFVPSFIGDDGKTYYYGDVKPSKDTVVQLKLYQKLKNINFIVHCHCHIEDAPFTKQPVPCGSLEEISEVFDVIKNSYNNDFDKEYYAINLIGHGCLVFGSDLNKMRQAKYLTRKLPERLEKVSDCFVGQYN